MRGHRRARTRLVPAAAALALVLGLGCTGGAVGPGRPPLWAPLPGQAQHQEVRWRYHPPRPAALRARLDLPGKRRLFVGDGGERWLLEGARVVAAAELAPERLVAVQHRSGSYYFTGASGARYRSGEPLGTFLGVEAPPEPFIAATTGDTSQLAVDRRGRLRRSTPSDDGWTPVGPEGVRFIDVAMNGKAGVALAWPDQLFSTSDGGAGWKKLRGAGLGVLRVARDARVGLVAEGPLGAYADLEKATPRPLDRSVQSERHELGRPAPRGPRASALLAAAAVVVGDAYVELERAPSTPAGRHWRFRAGRFDGPLHLRTVKALDDCRRVRLAGAGTTLVVACWESRGRRRVRFFRSEDGGETFAKEPGLDARGRFADVRIAVAPDGTTVVAGICPRDDDGAGCRAFGLQWRGEPPEEKAAASKPGRKADAGDTSATPDGGGSHEDGNAESTPGDEAPTHVWRAARVPTLGKTVHGVTFSRQGDRAYAVADRTKGTGLAVFTSVDGGRHFVARDLHLGDLRRPKLVGVEASEDGILGVRFSGRGRDGLRLVAADRDGREIGVAGPPVPGATVGAHGSRALAIEPRSGLVWQSRDAGASWSEAGEVPVRVCRGDAACQVPVACTALGCVIGDRLSRLGWEGSDDVRLPTLEQPSEVPPTSRRGLSQPLDCRVDEAGWQSLADAKAAPTAAQAAVGSAAWFMVGKDDLTAEVVSYRGRSGREPTVDRHVLLAPAKQEGGRLAFDGRLQVEGVAALRYRVVGSRLKDVEVAWDNLVEGTTGTGKLAARDGVSYRSGDYLYRYKHPYRAAPNLLSIASGGVHLRLHRRSGYRQPTHFFDGTGTVATIPALSWPGSRDGWGYQDMVRVGGRSYAFRFAAGDAVIVRALRRAGDWHHDARVVGLARAAKFGVRYEHRLTYLKGRPALQVFLGERRSGTARAVLFPFEADGTIATTPIPVPTQGDLSTAPRGCSAEERRKTPRLVMPWVEGSRRPIRVVDPAEPPRWLLTDRAVLHGTPEAPCVAAYDARGVPMAKDRRRPRALIDPADLGNGWLFRKAPDGPGIEYRALSCRPSSTLNPPEKIYAYDGTHVVTSP